MLKLKSEFEPILGYDSMKKVQELIAPPISEQTVKEIKKQEREYNRGWRYINLICDSCKDTGDMVQCDRCHLAFHPECFEPPLSLSELPEDEFLCRRCRMMPLPIEIPATTGETEVSSNSAENATKRRPVRKSAASKRIRQLNTVAEQEPVQLATCSSTMSPLEQLAQASQYLNPRAFSLPVGFVEFSEIPGSRRVGSSSRVRHPSGNELDVPTSTAETLKAGVSGGGAAGAAGHRVHSEQVIRRCFRCCLNRSKSPLVRCDYCPLDFHLDCLDPPLTSYPTGKWMCPNHVEPFLDSHMLRRNSLADRMALWKRYAGHELNERRVIDMFLSRIRRRHPAFMRKVKTEPFYQAVQVPSSIKAQYRAAVVAESSPLGSGPLEELRSLQNINGKAQMPLDSWHWPRSKISKSSRSLLKSAINYQRFCAAKRLLDFSRSFPQLSSLCTLPTSSSDSAPLLAVLIGHRRDEENQLAKWSVPFHRVTTCSTTIGTGLECDLRLSEFGSCNRASSYHAVLFLDQPTNTFELINYSPIGTTVDGSIYGNPDESTKTSCSILRPFLDSRRNTQSADSAEQSADRAGPEEPGRPSCCCKNDGLSAVSGWHGSAVLRHGSLLRFGCIELLFVVVSVGS